MKCVYKLLTKNIAEKRYIVGYILSREVTDNDLNLLDPDETVEPPRNLFTEDMRPCWVLGDDGSLSYNPALPSQEELLRDELNRLLKYLEETDWYVIRYLESGKSASNDITESRHRARERISDIRTTLAANNAPDSSVKSY